MPSLRKRLFSTKKKEPSSESVGPPGTPVGLVCETRFPSLTNGVRAPVRGSDVVTPASHEVEAFARPVPDLAAEIKAAESPLPVKESPFVQAEPEMDDVPKEKPEVAEEREVDNPEPAKYHVHAEQILHGLAGVGVVLSMILIKLLTPGFWELSTFIGAGFVGGLCTAVFYFKNRREKQAIGEMLRLSPGVKGLAALMGDLPTWLSYREKDKVEWLNKILSQMWPFYDKAICKHIKDLVEPIMEDVRPPIFKFIGFRKLTFGDVPFRVEGM
ncbi:hypothetical protein BSKO_02729 [Bryopsis sp. KO-2023]|nr:hypothetical protein BSKO_02729 [Bryopsis sp. KO-2023]